MLRSSQRRGPEFFGTFLLLNRIESGLSWWGRWVAEHAIRVTLTVFLGTGLLATQLQYFTLDTSSEGYYHADDPVRIQYDEFRSVFGRDSAILVALRPAGGVFEADFLEELRTLHEEIEDEVPLLVEVTSLLNVRETLGTEEGLEVGDFLENWPEGEEALRATEKRALANPLYSNFMLSSDGTITAIVIETEAYSPVAEGDALSGFDDTESEAESEPRLAITGAEDGRITVALQKILDRHRSDDLELHLAGAPAFSAVLSQKMGGDMALFTGVSVALVSVFLALLFRRVAAVILPLVTVVLSVVSTLSVMGATRTPMMPPTQIIPSFLLAVGIGGAVHLLVIFYQAQRRGDDKHTAISHALGHSGLAIIMTSLTTAGGLLSFIPAALRPISHFGAITPVGVLLSLFYVLTLLPALMSIFPMKAVEAQASETPSQQALVAVGAFSTRRAPVVLFGWGFVMALAVAGALRVHIGHFMLEWMPEREPMRQAMEFLNDEFGGSVSYELVISTKAENGLHEPETLRRLEQVQRLAEELKVLNVQGGKVVSIVDVVRETHRALNENRDAYYAIPEQRALVSQELLLFENSGSDDVEDLVTGQFDTARVTVRVPFVDGAEYMPYLDQLMPEARRIMGPDISVEVTGGVKMIGNTIRAALETMVKSYSTALVVITVLMIMLIGSFKMGLISMIPNLAPVMLTLGVMGWAGIPLDMFTLMIGTIVMGLAVDDTIHFMHNFRREYDASGNVDEAVARTLRGTGQAMLFTSCILAASFLVYTQAYMIHLFSFGLLTAVAILVAFLADITLAPALVSVALPKKQTGSGPE